jgi:hypothetical protein
MKNKDLPIGSKFSSLVTVSETYMKPVSKRRRRFVNVQCECGSPIKPVNLVDLVSGKVITCGCAKDGSQFITHGLSSSPLYGVWAGMKVRCDNPKAYKFEDYGGRGISYQPSWVDFESFYNDMSEHYVEGLELDRKDTNGNYTKENCSWVTRSVNCHNRRKRKDSACESIGVSMHHGNFRAKLFVDGTCKLRKSFKTELEAAFAYDDVSEQVYGDRPNKTIREDSHINTEAINL